MINRLAVAVLGTLGVAAAAVSAPAETHCQGNWSANGKVLPEGASIPYDFYAPDKNSSIRLDEEGAGLVTGAKVERVPNAILNKFVTEVVWAANSRQFAVNASEGGAVGTWWVFTSSSLPNKADSSPLVHVLRARLPPPKCHPAEDYNVAAIGWLNGGRELLAVAEAPPHSSCQDMSRLTGFIVSMPAMKIKAVLTEANLRKRYASMLGCRLVGSSEDQASSAKYLKK
jgi:hypothetical protein